MIVCLRPGVLRVEKIVKELGPMSESKADRVERGLLINLNTDEYYVSVIDNEM